jgi:hypothetical protein
MMKAFKYRSHRGTLADSLDTTIEFNSVEDFKSHVKQEAYYFDGDITVDKYGGIDERCGWDTHIVRVGGIAVGFTDGNVVLD